MTDDEANNSAGNSASGKQITVQKIYIKDLSFESPNAPQVFSGDWNPQTQLNLRSSHRPVGDDAHEVVLMLTVEAKYEDKTAFLVELQQAGVFGVTGFSAEER
ncbi:MAG: protein-export chaperone SecB, partial [Pseudomonadota bacterium]